MRHLKVNNRKRCLEWNHSKVTLTYPFSKLKIVPTSSDPIVEIYTDKETAGQWAFYKLKSGVEGNIPLDAFLEYNRDPEYIRKLVLFDLTCSVLKQIKKEKIPKRELARKMKTSPAQLYRLLNTANYSKTIDQMVRLLAVMGNEVVFELKAITTKHSKRAA